MSLGILLVPFVTPINLIDAYAKTVTVDQVQGSSTPGNQETFLPNEVTIDVGDTVVWTNSDRTTHTITSGDIDNPDNCGQLFDSGLTMPGIIFEYIFNNAGVYPYLCQLHPWMIGKVTVTEKPSADGISMSGTNFDLEISPTLPFDRMKNEMVTLSFAAKATQLEGASITPGKIDHLDYNVIITKDGNEIWNRQFHDHDGNLELVITPSSGSVKASGGEEDKSKTSTRSYKISGPIFTENGSYTFTTQVVGIEFNPLPSPIQDSFSIEVVPEFPIAIIGVMGVIVGMSVVVSRLNYYP